MGAVAARSNWTTGSSWMSFRAAPHTKNPSQGEQYFDQGSLALVRVGTPLVLTATGWVVHVPSGTAAENDVYSDNYGSFNSKNAAPGNRRPYNIFYVRNMNGSAVAEPFGQAAYTSEDQGVRTSVTGYEDAPDQVPVTVRLLPDMYRKFKAGAAVTGWTRQIVFLRPHGFLVYDRTSIGKSSYDQFTAWHFPALPLRCTFASGATRLDVTYNGKYVGAMTTILPTNAKIDSAMLYPDLQTSKVWQTQGRPPNTNAGQNWLTVFGLSPSSSIVASATSVVVTLGGITGVQLAANDSNNVVVISTGGTMKISANGVLDLSVNSGGTVQASAPPTIMRR